MHEGLRPFLFGVAYRMVGEVGDAEDLVQEAFLRLHRETSDVRDVRAYLTTVTTRLAIDHLRSARVRREEYVGPWLPEPLLSSPEDEDPAAKAERADTLSLAFLLLLERLTPQERAAFLLREVFGRPYGDIAEVLEASQDACRQLVSRAKRHIDAERPRFDADRRKQQELLERFLAASATGDITALEEILAADVAHHSDGGGKVWAARKPIVGAGKVALFLTRIASAGAESLGGFELVHVNGRPGVVLRLHDGRPQSVISLDIRGGRIQTIHAILNPDKLRHIA